MDPIGKKLLNVAKSELGYVEKGDGYTKFGEWYRKNVDGDHDEYFSTAPWCDMFLAWAADKAGVTEQAGQFASTVEHAKWFQGKDAFGTEPEPGAFIFFDWNGSDDIDQIDHIGLVERVDGKKIHTIEGNADGYKLTRKVRDMDTVVGFGYPSKVKVAQTYAPKHAAPPPAVEQLTGQPVADAVPGVTKETPADDAKPIGTQDAVLGGVLAMILFGTVALAAGRAGAAKAPTTPPIRVRKRGKHHKPSTPVKLPADVTPADLDAADTATTVMPALSLAVAHAAEDREFWGRIDHLKDDEELAFWDTLHAEFATEPAAAHAEYPSAPEFR
ncbi:CHAP domain-containing protein [Actinomadura flavalba]|uniref:CHAP domain-containing protein n=1 Tax=Actinomadura flavalba TaxID=1120938 RepID=UPI000373D8A7|nr:CHAP domain-containing protein [Actinomadura flavalba]